MNKKKLSIVIAVAVFTLVLNATQSSGQGTAPKPVGQSHSTAWVWSAQEEADYALRKAWSRLGLSLDSLLYPGFPNRFEGICFRLGRFVGSLDGVSTVMDGYSDLSVESQRFSKIKIKAESTLARFCGSLAAHDPNLRVDLQTPEQKEKWIQELQTALNTIGQELNPLVFR